MPAMTPLPGKAVAVWEWAVLTPDGGAFTRRGRCGPRNLYRAPRVDEPQTFRIGVRVQGSEGPWAEREVEVRPARATVGRAQATAGGRRASARLSSAAGVGDGRPGPVKGAPGGKETSSAGAPPGPGPGLPGRRLLRASRRKSRARGG